MDCSHESFYSGESRYEPDVGQLRLVLVCDECGSERAELGRIDYRPSARSDSHPVAEHAAE